MIPTIYLFFSLCLFHHECIYSSNAYLTLFTIDTT